MNRTEFMKILEQSLSVLSESEKEEALQYYEDYLNDAGIENEQEVMEELGAPELLAETIKAGLNGGGTGEYTERGYRHTQARAGQEAAARVSVGENTYEYEQNRTQQANEQRSNTSHSAQEPEQAAGQTQYGGAGQQPVNRGNSASRTILIIIACVVFGPILLPVAAALIAAAAGVIVGMFGIWIGFLAAGAAFFISGVICLVVGIVKLFTLPAAGVVLLGVGFLCLGAGLLLSALMLWLFAKLVPPFFRWLVALCKKPFGRRGGTA